MQKLNLIAIVLLIATSVFGQEVKPVCSERKVKNEIPELDSVIIETCYIRNFKFIKTTHPDYAGRYVYEENQVYRKVNGKYVSAVNSEFFNKNQIELLSEINRRIQNDFKNFSSDSLTKDCFSGIDSIPTYEMDDLEVSFYNDEIWFEVHWGLPSACRNVDGTIVAFKFRNITKYLN